MATVPGGSDVRNSSAHGLRSSGLGFPMSRGHPAIERLARLDGVLREPLEPDQVTDLRATLYGSDAVLTLHLAQGNRTTSALVEREQ